MSERFAALNASITSGAEFLPLFFFTSERDLSMNIHFYEINAQYIDYLSAIEPHFFHNKRSRQQNERKYIDIILQVNGMNYFAPLSSFKPKHTKMDECVDFIKIKNYAVININNMFPVPEGLYTYIDIQKVKNVRYRALLQAEYRIIKKLRYPILKNACRNYRL
ncbi:MAG: type III toxin-antitoxin system ToxN/AbiQ family toxin [Lachnospiraceae bacterium]|nr:type III toxin-antitoxin system ToxN/AbiQ family toxin [Lachnospiraceae bacterium]